MSINTNPFKTVQTKPEDIIGEDIEELKKPKEDRWKKEGSQRLITGGSFKLLQTILTGGLGGMLWIIIYPRLISQPEVFGITSIVATVLGLFGSLFDWGIWTGFQRSLAGSMGLNDKEQTKKLTRTMMTFKIFNGFAYNVAVFAFLIFLFPHISVFNTYTDAYRVCFMFVSIKWFFSFADMFEHVIAAGSRFDFEFYISIFELIDTLALKLFWLWASNTFLFPGNVIVANAVAIAVSDFIEGILKYLLRFIAIRKLQRRGKLNIFPIRQMLKPGFDKKILKNMLGYGTFVFGRQILGYFAEAGSLLWMILLSIFWTKSNPAEFIGFWNLAASTTSIFLVASTLNRPVFPAISEAYIKKEHKLIRQYCITSGKWFFVWAWFALGIYIAWGEEILRFISGDQWILSGQIVRVIAPAVFGRFGNEYLIGILNAIGKPKHVMKGTALKIPVMVLGAILFFPTQRYGYYALVYALMELTFFIYLLRQMQPILHVRMPSWIYIIPGIACGVAMLVPSLLYFSILAKTSTLVTLIVMLLMYAAIFFFVFVWMGGIEAKDFDDYQESFKAFFKKDEDAVIFVRRFRKMAKISFLYGKFTSEQSDEAITEEAIPEKKPKIIRFGMKLK
jgi:O-antigen/teichoic acid export membrane protein